MAYLVGYLGTPILIAFLITHLGIRRSYRKKHGQEMGAGKEILYIFGIAILLLFLMLL